MLTVRMVGRKNVRYPEYLLRVYVHRGKAQQVATQQMCLELTQSWPGGGGVRWWRGYPYLFRHIHKMQGIFLSRLNNSLES